MSALEQILDAPALAEFLRGAVEVTGTADGLRPQRLPAWARAQADDPQLSMVAAQPAGVRLHAVTAARRIELTARATRYVYRGLPPRAAGVFDLLVDGAPAACATLDRAVTVTIDPRTGDRETVDAGPGTLVFDALPPGPKLVEIWLPHHEECELLGLRSDALLLPSDGPSPVWLHHGSSISQGSNATRPTGTWPAVAALRSEVDLINLGFGGSALVDPFVARTIRDTPADLISVKLGINVVNTDAMRRRAFRTAVHGFLDTVRDGHRDIPLVLVSPLFCGVHEATPGPGAFDPAALAHGESRFVATGRPDEVRDGKLTLETIRAELERIVDQRAAHDPNLRYLSGLELYGPDDAARYPLPDGLHPDDAAHEVIGTRFADRVLTPRERP